METRCRRALRYSPAANDLRSLPTRLTATAHNPTLYPRWEDLASSPHEERHHEETVERDRLNLARWVPGTQRELCIFRVTFELPRLFAGIRTRC